MNQNITLRIRAVSKEEIEQLNTAVSAMSDTRFEGFNISIQNAQNYVLSICPRHMAEIGEIVDSLQRVVRGDRILLDLL